jgi:para-nitrobenzyl esterase
MLQNRPGLAHPAPGAWIGTARRWCGLATIALALGLLAAPTASPAVGPGTLIHTDKGWLLGSTTPSGMRTFFGIPFAQPPTGALRFHAPVPPSPWGVRLAFSHSSPCPQLRVLTNENCLGLDVYAPPAAASQHLPVMVWFYGGGYVLGWNSMYDPAPLVATGKVIVVTVNYRVGPFGFLALPGLESESPTGQATGDYGLMDQQAGLRWVQRNIAAFGGDPRNVTIFGESSGGNSVCSQVASPPATGLFQRAISESGFCGASATLDVHSQPQVIADSEAYAARVGCPDAATMLSCLRALPASKLEADPTVSNPAPSVGVWVPDIDGYVLPRSLQDAWSSGRFNHVPMVIGTNLNEARLFVALDEVPQLKALTPEQYTAWVEQVFGSQAQSVLAEYPVSAYGAADLAEAQAFTDVSFACTASYEAEHASANGQQLWQYEFADPNPPFSKLDPFMNLGDFHASELFYLFDLFGVPISFSPAQQSLSAEMIAAWTNFAATGQPGPIGDADWPRFTDGSPQTMVLTSQGSHTIDDFANEHQCAFWRTITGG